MRRSLVRPGPDAGFLHRRDRVSDGGAADAERHGGGDEPSLRLREFSGNLDARQRHFAAAQTCQRVRHHGGVRLTVNR